MKLEQLTKRIRELVPSTMELSFGCEVLMADGQRGTLSSDVVGGNFYLYNTTNYRFPHVTQIKAILGHPIQLHHVLQAIKIKTEDSVKSFTMTAAGCMDFSENSIPRYFHVYDVTKPLDGQSTETLDFLYELLA